jgi:hypothetical protein
VPVKWLVCQALAYGDGRRQCPVASQGIVRPAALIVVLWRDMFADLNVRLSYLMAILMTSSYRRRIGLYKENYLLECEVVQSALSTPPFRKKILPPCQGQRVSQVSNRPEASKFSLLLFFTEGGGSTSLLLPHCTASHHRKQRSTQSPVSKPQPPSPNVTSSRRS